jgi:hypothetical protein
MIAFLAQPAHARGVARPKPAVFALPAAYFPPRSRIARSGIETNRQLLRDQALSFGLPGGLLGRQTGYFADAVDAGSPSRPTASTFYLVSIFGSPRQAQAAFDDRWDTWFAIDYNTTPPSAPIAVGDRGAEALFHTLDPRQPAQTELFFRRGAVLVEVFQSGTSKARSSERIRAFYRIAARLDVRARQHPYG